MNNDGIKKCANYSLTSKTTYNNKFYFLVESKCIGDEVVFIRTAQIDTVLVYSGSLNSKPLYFGSKVNQMDKLVWDRNIIIPNEIWNQNHDTIFIEIRNKSSYNVKVEFKNKAGYTAQENKVNMFFGAYIGIVLIFILIQIFVFSAFKLYDYNYFYLLYLINTSLYFTTEFGFSGLYLWPNQANIDEMMTFTFILGSGFFLFLFTFNFLKGSINYSNVLVNRYMMILFVILLICVFSRLFDNMYLYDLFFIIVLLSVVVFYLLSIIISVFGIVRKVTYSKVIFVSLLGILFGAIIKPFTFSGFLSNNFITQYSAILGHLFEIVIITSVIINYGINENKIKRKIEIENLLLQKTALASQISPHFIFNGLNSVQYFIQHNKSDDAINFIGLYAKLIRLSLKANSKNSICIKDELEMIEMYLQIESYKANFAFDYNISSNLTEDEEYITFISPMILQPFIENAIIHGIAKRKENALIEIQFFLKNDFLKVSISDNGVGHKNNENNLKKESYGKNLTQRRLELLHKENVIKYSVPFPHDFKFPGTKVEIDIYIGG